MSIDTKKWMVANLDPTKVRIEKNGAIELINYGTTAVADAQFMRNSVRSIRGSTTGIFGFTATSIYPMANIYQSFGLYVDDSNRIEFYRKNSGSYNLTFRIIVAGIEVYSTDDVVRDFGKYEIRVSAANVISAFLWNGSSWAQIGTNQTVELGTKYIFVASCGGTISKLSLSNSYIKPLTGVYTPLYTKPLITVSSSTSDARIYGARGDGSTDDITAINTAIAAGDTILQDGIFVISSAILIPTNRTLYLKNCKIFLANGSYDNIFRNSDCLNGNTSVNVIGLGNAVIDHNAANNWSEDYEIYGGKSLLAENLYKASTFFLCNATTFSIKNLIIVDRPHYAGCLQRGSDGIIEDLFFNHYTLCQNQDGIQCIYGTHDINFKRLHGRTGDDFVSIFIGTKFGTLFYPLENFTIGDCYNMTWDDVIVYSQYHAIIFICGDGNKIYNINFKNAYLARVLFIAYFGYNYYTVAPTADEFYGITMDNITLVNNAADYAFDFRNDCKDIAITNFSNNSGKIDYQITSGDQSDNVTINGVQVI